MGARQRASGGEARHGVIVGAGTMGAGLARLLIRHGWRVTVVDRSAEALARCRSALDPSLATFAQGWSDVSDAALVLEAVTEDLAVKRAVLAEAEDALPADTPILSNSSGLTAAALAAEMAHPERFLIAHFFNPPDVIPAVELVPSTATDPALVEHICADLRTLGKRPAVLKRDIPGFVANRVQHAIMRECLALLEAGVADAREIDDILRGSVGLRMAIQGPFVQRDLNGLDTHLNIATYLYPVLSSATEPAAALSDRVARGALGIKTGRGFYDWTDETTRDALRREAELLERISSLLAPPGDGEGEMP